MHKAKLARTGTPGRGTLLATNNVRRSSAIVDSATQLGVSQGTIGNDLETLNIMFNVYWLRTISL
jgi:hypothetical protein